MTEIKHQGPFHSSREEVSNITVEGMPFELAFTDEKFLLREELRPVRLQLELLKPELILQDHGIENTIVFFGSARIPTADVAKAQLEEAQTHLEKHPGDAGAEKRVRTAENVMANSQYLDEASKLASMVSEDSNNNYFVVTGGGPSFMEAANKGAYDANKISVSLGVVLPHEQLPNPYVTQSLSFQFHYFAIRKMHFLMRAKALVAFPGGFGTMDELFETLTLLQTEKIHKIPLLLFRKAFWDSVINFEALVEQGTISEQDLELFHFVETADEAWEIINDFHQNALNTDK